MKKEIILIEGRHFTLTSLAMYLNDRYGKKSSGNLFTPVDVQKYVSRGRLPEYLGGNLLSELRNDTMGLKLIVVHDEVHIKPAGRGKSR